MTGRSNGETANTTLAGAIAEHAERAPEAPAVIGPQHTWTYGAVAELVAQHEPGPAIVIVEHRDGADLAVATIAAFAAAATVAPLAGHPDDVHAELARRVRRAAPIDHGAIVFPTSGSSGEPKLVPNTQVNLRASAMVARAGVALGPDDTCLALGSMAHTLGLRAVTDALWWGASVVIPADLDHPALRAAFLARSPTGIVAAPPGLQAVADLLDRLTPEEQQRMGGSLRWIRSGSAALRPGLHDRLSSLFDAPILHGYGMSEVAKIACTPLQGGAPAASVGRPTGVEVRIVRDGHVVGPGGRGEIQVRGEAVTPGYLDDPARTAAAFVGGWFRTGDLGWLDPDGYLLLDGRADDTVSRGGALVSLGALEAAVERHAGVRSALATGIEHESLGTEVAVGFVSTDVRQPVDAVDLRAHLLAVLPAEQVPTRLVPLDELPLTPSGKPSRRGLAAALARSSARADAPPARLTRTEGRLAEVWTSVLSHEQALRPDADFFASGGDSLRLVQLCSRIAEVFGVELLPGSLIGHPSLRAMADLLDVGDGPDPHSTLAPLHVGPPGCAPLYFVPGNGGTVAALLPWIRGVGESRSVWGFEAPGLYRGERSPRRVGDLADRYVRDLLVILGDGPYVLGGFSFGTIVAQEMCRQLEALGRPPARLVLLDYPVPSRLARPTHRLRRLVLRSIRRTTTARPAERLGARIERTKRAAQASARRHRPGVTHVSTIVVVSERRVARDGDDALGWRAYLGGSVEVIQLPGRHIDLIRARAGTTTQAVIDALAEVDAERPAPMVGPVP